MNAKTSVAVGHPGSAVNAVLHDIALRYPEELVAGQQRDVPRIAFNIGLVVDRVGIHASVCDLGGGVGLFSVGCAALGLRSTLVDDFRDTVNFKHASLPKTLHRSMGVDVIDCDVVNASPGISADSLDVVTTFDSMEHWHHSPKKLFRDAMSWLRPGGLLIIGVPNCVNLRKRLTVPLGRGKWSSMQDWYEPETFRGHVREPDVDDLRYIARDLKLTHTQILGRNWLGYGHPNLLIRSAISLVDGALQCFPSFCADLYLVGHKEL
jgi:2-polyprenyl-3-methyl-5-hydroxy-6-metoxy-1,4-benzoquinol methylase